METPKISVLIPLYNRKHYIAECVDSVLNQTFQDFEIIIRDDCSTDDSFEFVQDKYSAQISNGKIKLIRNLKNLGEFGNIKRLFYDATGKYLYILHSDDLFLPHALAHLFETAEKYNADVVHCIGHLFTPPIIEQNTRLRLVHSDRTLVNEVQIMSDEPIFRLQEWSEGGIFCDAQYNLFKRDLIMGNEIFFNTLPYGLNVFHLAWLMNSKIFVKTPVTYYIRRDAPDSKTNERSMSFYTVEHYIDDMMDFAHRLDRELKAIDFVKDHEQIKRFVKFKFLTQHDAFELFRVGFYREGMSTELDFAVENTFRKHLGDSGFYVAILFNMIHSAQYGHDINKIMLKNTLDAIKL